MKKSKWSILVEYDAQNLKAFEEAFYDDKFLYIAREWVKGIIQIDTEPGQEQK